MSTKPPANLPPALSAARRPFDQWRRRNRKHARLPQALWRRAAALAREHGLSKTASYLGLNYYSLRKHLAKTASAEAIPAKAEPDFIELLPGVLTPGVVECMIEWSDTGGSSVRMHIQGARLAELASLAGVLRGGRP